MKKVSPEFLKNLLLIVIVGAAAGAIGALAAWSALLSYQTSLALFDVPRLLDQRQAGSADSFEHAEAQAELVLAEFFIAKRDASARYFPHEAFARGVVLSSDGWLAAPSEISRRPAAQIRAGIGPQLFEISQIIEDDDAGLVFVKVAARNLSAAAISSGFGMADNVFAAAPLHGGTVLATMKSPITQPFDADILPPIFSFAKSLELVPGTPLFDSSGRLAGIAESSGKIITAAIIRPALDSLLAAGKIERPSLGVFGFHLSGTRSEAGGRERGFLIARPDSGVPAVRADSAGRAADLREGDIILKWNDTVLNGKALLSELLLAKRAGDKVELRVARNGDEFSVTVELGSR